MKKRFFVLLFCLALMLNMLSACGSSNHGKIGDDLSWTLSDEGVLTISGSGKVREIDSEYDLYYERSRIESVVIEEGVTDIGFRAFNHFEALKNVKIPNSVSWFALDAFDDCISLTSIEVDESNPWYSVDNNSVLYNKDKTELIMAPKRLTGEFTIPDEVEFVCDNAFKNCTLLQSVAIPDSVTSIGEFAFEGCTSLESVTIPDCVPEIAYGAFSGCTSLKNIAIPDSVTSIGDFSFERCTSLESIAIPDGVTDIKSSTFSGCTSLKSVAIPDSVTSISLYAFADCKSLANVRIPDNVTVIEDFVFSGCTSLKSIMIPGSVTSIGEEVFTGCSSLSGINVEADNPKYSSDDRGVLFNKDKTILIQAPTGMTGEYTVPESVKSIDKKAFDESIPLTSIVFKGDAPEIIDSFNRLDITAYYPADNDTWKDFVKYNAQLDGKKITWVEYYP